MDALYDPTGALRAWLDASDGMVVDRAGARLACLCGNRLHAWDGQQIGWWQDGSIGDLAGSIALFTATAGNLPHLPPYRATPALAPTAVRGPLRAFRPPARLRPIRGLGWSSMPPI
jgi:hypothetical protein